MHRAILVALLTVGCGGSTAAEPSDAGSDTVAFDIGSVDAPRTPSTCPSTPPTDGTGCVPSGLGALLCTYGDEFAPWCRTRVACDLTTSKWLQQHNGSCTTECPTTAPTVGTECTGTSACAWADGTMCICYPGPTRTWRCEPPPADTRCPRLAPNLGSACTTEGVECRYTIARGCLDCSPLGYTATCVDAVWQRPSGLSGP